MEIGPVDACSYQGAPIGAICLDQRPEAGACPFDATAS